MPEIEQKIVRYRILVTMSKGRNLIWNQLNKLNTDLIFKKLEELKTKAPELGEATKITIRIKGG
jgi:hypothetical protein